MRAGSHARERFEPLLTACELLQIYDQVLAAYSFHSVHPTTSMWNTPQSKCRIIFHISVTAGFLFLQIKTSQWFPPWKQVPVLLTDSYLSCFPSSSSSFASRDVSPAAHWNFSVDLDLTSEPYDTLCDSSVWKRHFLFKWFFFYSLSLLFSARRLLLAWTLCCCYILVLLGSDLSGQRWGSVFTLCSRTRLALWK